MQKGEMRANSQILDAVMDCDCRCGHTTEKLGKKAVNNFYDRLSYT
jgi:hypothetical protein